MDVTVPAAAEPSVTTPAAPAETLPGLEGLGSAPEYVEGLPGVLATKPDRPAGGARATRPTPAPASAAPAGPDGAQAANPAASGVSTGTPGSDNAPEPPAPAKFVLAPGLEWDSQEAAAQAHRTLQGMHRAKQSQINEMRLALVERDNELRRLREGTSSQTATPASAEPPKGNPEAPAPAGTKWKVAESLREKLGPEAANRYLDEQFESERRAMQEALEQKFQSSLEERLRPYDEQMAQYQAVQAADQLVKQMQTWRTVHGEEAYPELKDRATIVGIRKLWDQMGFPAEEILTPRGLHTAVVNYRDNVQRMRPRTPAPPQSTPAAPVPTPASPVISAVGDQPTRGTRQSADLASMADQITAAPLKVDPDFGFSLNR